MVNSLYVNKVVIWGIICINKEIKRDRAAKVREELAHARTMPSACLRTKGNCEIFLSGGSSLVNGLQLIG